MSMINWAFWIMGALFGGVVVAGILLGIFQNLADRLYLLIFHWRIKPKDDTYAIGFKKENKAH
jgi:hypothetical protein